MVQRIVAGGKQIQALGEDLFEGVPEVLRAETLGGNPQAESRIVLRYQSVTSVFGPG